MNRQVASATFTATIKDFFMLTARVLHPDMLKSVNESALLTLETLTKNNNVNKDSSDFLAAYNTWLQDYLQQGNRLTHFYSYPCPAIVVVTDPRSQHPRNPDGMCGTDSRRYILPPEIDATKWGNKFVTRRSHNKLYGWTNDGKTAVVYGGWVPAYSNTIDKQIMNDNSVLESIRRPILQGVAKANEQDRALNLRNAFYNIGHECANSRMRDKGAHKMGHVLEWRAKTRNNGTAPALKKPTHQMHVDFNKGDGWAFNTFLYEESNLYRFKDANPAEYLATLGAVTATFITNDIAVVTDTGYDSRDPQPLIILTTTTPTGQNLAGYSYTIDTVKPGGEWEPASVTFKA